MLNRIASTIAGMNQLVHDAGQHFDLPTAVLWPRVLKRYFIDHFSIAELRAYAPLVSDVLETIPVLISKEASLTKLARVNSMSLQWQTEDKEKFYEICERDDIPHPKVCAVIGGGRDYRKQELPKHFISKDSDGAYASGFAVFERIGATGVSVNGGPLERLDEVLGCLVQGDSTLLLQERLFDHPGLQEISMKRGLQTARINTYRTADGKPGLLFWMIKLVVGTNLSDNFAGGTSGNLIAFGHPDNGSLLGARTLCKNGVGLATIRYHPETNRPLNEFTVPLWREAVETALRAHNSFPDFGALGWDVAITREGPKILEANAWWDPPTYAPQLMSREHWQTLFA